MATVTATLAKRIKLGSADWVVEVKEGRQKIGQLQISAGTLDWWPGGTSENGTHLTWAKFADLMAQQHPGDAKPRHRKNVRQRRVVP